MASIFEMSIEAVPNFAAHDGGWWKALESWTRALGFMPVWIECENGDSQWLRFPGYVIVAGETPKGTKHCVVHRSGELVHDPLPGGSGLVSYDGCIVFAALDPARAQEN